MFCSMASAVPEARAAAQAQSTLAMAELAACRRVEWGRPVHLEDMSSCTAEGSLPTRHHMVAGRLVSGPHLGNRRGDRGGCGSRGAAAGGGAGCDDRHCIPAGDVGQNMV
jgi:hypothetical protein